MIKHINVNDKMKNAFEYETNPATFSRAVKINPASLKSIVYVSGTASIGSNGETLHKGDFKKQLWQTFDNLTEVLEKSYMSWKNVIRTTIYLRDIDRDYEDFNIIRKEFFDKQGITEYPASTCIGAKICRPDLLCEIELIAVR
jgi:enamine deaminase RidA (YjgF/YER057c/UK114 family)